MSFQLYYLPGACSLSMHMALIKSGITFEAIKPDRAEMKQPAYLKLNPKGVVPTLVHDGKPVVEGLAIMLYLVDALPQANLGPQHGDAKRYDLHRWLAFLDGGLHVAFGPVFGPQRYLDDESQKDALRAKAHERVEALLELVEKEGLTGKPYLLGDTVSIADYHLFTILRWVPALGGDDLLASFPQIKAFQSRIGALPEVQQALREEGLDKPKAA